MKLVFLKLSKNGWSESLAVKTTYLTHYVSYSNLEGEVSSCKMNRFIGNLSSNWKWAWQAQFLSYWPIILENWISFKDVQMLLLSFFEIPYGDRLAENVQKQYVQVIPRSTDYETKTLPLDQQVKNFSFTELEVVFLYQVLWPMISWKMNYDLFLMNVIVILSKIVLAYLARWISPNLVQNR